MRRISCLLLMLMGLVGHGYGAGLRLGSVLGETGDAGFLQAREPRPFEFPRDHGAHPDYRSEWWYLTASLEAADGREFGVQFTMFRQGLRAEPRTASPWDAAQIYLGHLAVTDVADGRHRHAERLARAHPRLAGVRPAPFDACLDGWRLASRGPGLEGLAVTGRSAGFAVRLEFDPVKPVVPQGDRGLSAKGPNQASYYFSVPRLSGGGEIQLDGRTFQVTGNAWLDREWSTSVLTEEQTGWDWFGLQLDGAEELMVFQLRRRSGVRDPYDQGVWVRPDGSSRALRTQDFTLQPRRWWRDADGVRWPVAWALSVMGPDGPRQFRVEAVVDDQRMDALFTYWEGLVRVYDERGDDIGSGYMELTGYE